MMQRVPLITPGPMKAGMSTMLKRTVRPRPGLHSFAQRKHTKRLYQNCERNQARPKGSSMQSKLSYVACGMQPGTASRWNNSERLHQHVCLAIAKRACFEKSHVVMILSMNSNEEITKASSFQAVNPSKTLCLPGLVC
jgi:hypothetical protein